MNHGEARCSRGSEQGKGLAAFAKTSVHCPQQREQQSNPRSFAAQAGQFSDQPGHAECEAGRESCDAGGSREQPREATESQSRCAGRCRCHPDNGASRVSNRSGNSEPLPEPSVPGQLVGFEIHRDAVVQRRGGEAVCFEHREYVGDVIPAGVRAAQRVELLPHEKHAECERGQSNGCEFERAAERRVEFCCQRAPITAASMRCERARCAGKHQPAGDR